MNTTKTGVQHISILSYKAGPVSVGDVFAYSVSLLRKKHIFGSFTQLLKAQKPLREWEDWYFFTILVTSLILLNTNSSKNLTEWLIYYCNRQKINYSRKKDNEMFAAITNPRLLCSEIIPHEINFYVIQIIFNPAFCMSPAANGQLWYFMENGLWIQRAFWDEALSVQILLQKAKLQRPWHCPWIIHCCLSHWAILNSIKIIILSFTYVLSILLHTVYNPIPCFI